MFSYRLRTIGAKINLKPVLESAFKYKSIEIHKDNIIIILLIKYKKIIYICRILQRY